MEQSRTPIRPFDRVTAELRARLASGEWPPGTQLPAVGTLADQHGTSKATVSRVVKLLADEGLLQVIQGWGTFAAQTGK